MVEVAITFLALLALVALVGAGVALAQGTRILPAPDSILRRYAGDLAAAVAIVATLGSLFMSEIAGFVPCLLCWVQRGFMYPLALVLALRSFLRVPPVWLMSWAVSGWLVSAYHYAEEHIPALARSSFCGPEMPCSFIWFERFGFVTLPFMAFSGFAAIAGLMFVEHRRAKENAVIAPARES